MSRLESHRSISSRFGFSSSRRNAIDVEYDDAAGSTSPSLELIKLVGNSTQGGGDETPVSHQVIEMSSTCLEPRRVSFVLSFSNLTYNVKIRPKITFSTLLNPQNRLEAVDGTAEAETKSTRTKTLLNNISGEARDGELMAVLGASGSGKSTLIDALANRIAKGSLKGTIKLNGETLESRMLKTISAYVMQDDLLFPMLTVEETLLFAAEFRLPRSLSKTKKKARVQALIDQLGLRNAATTVIGDEGHRGVSGGERRRVSIGIDIIHDPIVLFLDEPTSGLDSTSAFMVVKVLQRIAQSGSVVIMSIHQPSYRIIGLLDRMIFLSRGQTVFSGSPSNIPLYFSEFGRQIPENENRTEFALDLIRELEVSPGGVKSLVEFNKSWQNLRNSRKLETGQEGLSLKDAIAASISKGKLVSGNANSNSPSSSTMATFANPIWKEIVVLSQRSIKNSWRTPELFGTRLAAVVITGFILATMFWKLDNTPRGVEERLGFFVFAMSTMFYTCADALPPFLQERYIFMRETAYNAYRRSSYIISRSIVGLPPLFFLSITFTVITFFAVGLSGGASGLLFYFLIIFASFWAGTSFVTFLSAVVPNVMIGYVLVVAILAYFLLVSGFFINRDRIPDYWIWFHYMSLIKYPYEAVMINELSDPSRCFVRGAQIFDKTPLAVVPYELKMKLLKSMSKTLGSEITSSSCVTRGPDLLMSQGITTLSKWECLWVTVAWGFFYRILFYLALLLGSKNKRN